MIRIAFDSHKRYTFCSVEDWSGKIVTERRLEHEPGELRRFLSQFPAGTRVAVETIGNWYWIVDEIEAAGMVALLVHAHKAKLMLGCVNKTDKLDARGLNVLQRVGTVPTVWIPPGELRDKRSLTRTRMYLVGQRSSLKCRIRSTLTAYNRSVKDVSDIFCPKGRKPLLAELELLPRCTRFTCVRQLEQIDLYNCHVLQLDKLIKELFEETEEICLLKTLPGIGKVLSIVISLEVGDVGRFASAEKLASYSGTTPRVHASGGRCRYGGLRKDVNRSLKWAFLEAANAISTKQRVWWRQHAIKLYKRIREKRGHQKAIGAVAHHLAEASYWVLKKREAYRDPGYDTVSEHRERKRLYVMSP